MRKFIEYIYIYIYQINERRLYLLEPQGSGVKDI